MNEKLLNEKLAKDLLLEQTFVSPENIHRSAPKPKQEVKLLEEQDTDLSSESADLSTLRKQLRNFISQVKEEPGVYALTFITVIAILAISLIQQAL